MTVKIVSALLISVGLWFGIQLRAVGEFSSLTPHGPADCREIHGIAGPEDMVVADVARTVFISSLDRRRGGDDAQGAIYRYRPGVSGAALEKVAPRDFPADFRPHGLGTWVEPDGRINLFVINHRRDGDVVEIFAVVNGQLTHKESIADPLFVNANAIVPVGARSFYLTSDHSARSELGSRLQDYLMRETGSVLFYDGTRARYVARDIAFANGMALDTQHSLLYVASMLSRKLLVYRRDARTGDLASMGSIDLPSAPDNVRLDAAGRLLIGAHPRLFTLGLVRDAIKQYAPSQVLRVSPSVDQPARIEELYLNRGERISSSSVAVAVADQLFIGNIYDDHVLVCRGVQ